MDQWILAEYHRLRSQGWPAGHAIRAARAKDAFECFEAEGLAKFEVMMDDEGHDSSYVDTWTHLRVSERKRAKQEISERAYNDGTWSIVVSIRESEDDEWEVVDSCGDFVGDDWRDSGYDTDLMESAAEALQKRAAA